MFGNVHNNLMAGQLAGRLNGRLRDDKLASNGLNIFNSATETAPGAQNEIVEPFDAAAEAAAETVALELASLLSAHEMSSSQLARAKFLLEQHKNSHR